MRLPASLACSMATASENSVTCHFPQSSVVTTATLSNMTMPLSTKNQMGSISIPVVGTGNQTQIMTSTNNQTFVLDNQIVSIDGQSVDIERGFTSVSGSVINNVVPDTVTSLMENINTVPASQACLVQTTLPFVDALEGSPIMEAEATPASEVQEVHYGASNTVTVPQSEQEYISQQAEGGLMPTEETYVAIPISDDTYTHIDGCNDYMQISNPDPNMQFSTGQFLDQQNVVLEQTVGQEEVVNMTECNQIVNNTLSISDVNNLTNIITEASVLNEQGQVMTGDIVGITYDSVNQMATNGDMVVETVQEVMCTEGPGLEVIQGQEGFSGADGNQIDTS